MLKRLFDILLSLTGLTVFSPVFLIIALWVRLSHGGPVFYRGVRVGRRGKLFRIFKFRTMVIDAERLGGPSTSDDDPRITKVGKFLRNYKLDELPQLINVLKGEMSFVGPRPEVQQEVELYTEEEKAVLNVRPGITDYASIKFHNEGEILKGSADPHQAYQALIRPEKIRLALDYVNNHSLGIDMRILVNTFKTLVVARFKQDAVFKRSRPC